MTTKTKFPQYPPTYRAVIDEDPIGFFDWHRKQARKGNVDSARELMHGFCAYVAEQKSVPVPILNYVSLAFSEYLLDAAPIDKALLLRRPGHRPRGISTVDPIRAVATLYLYIKRDGLKKGKAKQKTADDLILQVRTLEKHDREWGPFVQGLTVQELIGFSESKSA